MIQSGVASGDITPEPGPVLQGHWNTNPIAFCTLPSGSAGSCICRRRRTNSHRHTRRHRHNQSHHRPNPGESGKYYSGRQRNGSV